MTMTMVELDEKIGQLTHSITEMVGVMQETATSDKARWGNADAERDRLAGELESLKEQRESEVRREKTEKAAADMEHFLSTVRTPSKAALAGNGRMIDAAYQDGDFITAIFEAKSSDFAVQQAGKAKVAEMGLRQYEAARGRILEIDADGKATLGGTGAIGSTGSIGMYIAPNNFVDRLIEIATPLNPMRQLMTVIDGVTTPGVDIPVEAAIPLRAVVSAWGDTKENIDVTYARYTATFFTIARIHDVSNQLLRYSRGAAEKDMVSRLGRAFGLGEAYYILSGAGTTEPKGLITSLAASGAYDTADAAGYATPGASVYGSIAKAVGALEARARTVDGILMNPSDFWTYLALEGSAVRPYLNSYMAGQPLPAVNNPRSALFEAQITRNQNVPAGTAILGEFKSANLYTGLGFRIDTSDQAGTRWDKNLTGFRAEEEIAFNADPYVVAGMFQRITSVGN